jgi:hypothetical protein
MDVKTRGSAHPLFVEKCDLNKGELDFKPQTTDFKP